MVLLLPDVSRTLSTPVLLLFIFIAVDMKKILILSGKGVIVSEIFSDLVVAKWFLYNR